MYRFTLKFDDPLHSMDAENGVPFELLAEALVALHEAVKKGKVNPCTLSQVRGNCYALDLSSTDQDYYSRLIVVHERLATKSFVDLSAKEAAYAKKLKPILKLKSGLFLETFDTNRNEVAKISRIEDTPLIAGYYSSTSVSGRVVEIGAPKEDVRPHIRIAGFAHDIFVTNEQHDDIMPHYKIRPLAIRIRIRKELGTGKFKSAELLDFSVKQQGKFTENLAKIREEIGRFLEGTMFDEQGEPITADPK